ncbi:hypothetical protein CASFOL_025300 [Castilleja foliolosa]|uniref:Ribosomal protein L20 n=1 Tax=Castilleja foliolosa TaxID=1961234 RepID=A0ABD3CQQ7_9LAMI
MNTASRNSYSYNVEAKRQGHHGMRITRDVNNAMIYRRDRARKRLIFLQSYKLGSVESSGKFMKSRKLNKMVVKVKTAMVSVLAFMSAPSSTRAAQIC